MRNAPALKRALCALLLTLLLGSRLLAPAGFMPSFEHGAVTIIACPDGDSGAAPMSAHHPGHSKKLHQECPFASASGLGALALDAVTLASVLVLAVELLLGRAFLFLEPSRANARPPLRGPPILA